MNLKNVTYLSIVPNKSNKIYQNINSIIKIGNNSSKNLNFGEKIIYTFEYPTIDPGDFKIKKIDEIPFDKFNDFILKNYSNLFNTDYAINFHSDGFIQNQNKWDENFLKYDFIGAPLNLNINNTSKFIVGNGGFSLRSKKLCNKISELYNNNYYPKNLDIFPGYNIDINFIKKLPKIFSNEDVYISLFCNNILLENNFKISDFNNASKFSTEHFSLINNKIEKFSNSMINSFGFHEIDLLDNNLLKNIRKKIQREIANGY